MCQVHEMTGDPTFLAPPGVDLLPTGVYYSLRPPIPVLALFRDDLRGIG